MKPGISNTIRSRIKEVAKLRVEGATWAVIATRYGYKHNQSARQSLTLKYPVLWRDEYELARALYLDEIEGEAILTQRELIRPTRIVTHHDPDTGAETEERVDNPLDMRQRAAHSILAHCAKLRARKVEVTGSMEHEHKGDVNIDERIEAYAKALTGGEGPEGPEDEPTGDTPPDA